VSPDGKHITISSSGDLGLFDPEACKPPKTPKPDVMVPCTLKNAKTMMVWTCVAFSPPSPDGSWLALEETGATDHGSVHITKAKVLLDKAVGRDGNQKLNTVRLADVQTRTFPPFGAPIASLAFSADGNTLVAGGGKKTVDLYSLKDA